MLNYLTKINNYTLILNNQRRMYSTDNFDFSVIEDLLNTEKKVYVKPVKVDSITQNFLFDMSGHPFNIKNDVKLIVNTLANYSRNITDTSKKYQFHIYILISGKRANVLPEEAKDRIANVLDQFNNINLQPLNYSILTKVKEKHVTIKERLSAILNTSDFSDTIVNDTRHVQHTINTVITRIKDQTPFKGLTISMLPIPKRIKDLTFTDNDILINTDKENLMINIKKAKDMEKSIPKKVRKTVSNDNKATNSVSSSKNKSRSNTPASQASSNQGLPTTTSEINIS